MNSNELKSLAVWEVKVNIGLWLINGLVLVFLSLTGQTFLQLVNSGFFSKIALLETGVAFIVGGVVAFSGSASMHKTKELLAKSNDPWSIDKLKTSEKRANKYLLLAIIMFLQALLISVLGF